MKAPRRRPTIDRFRLAPPSEREPEFGALIHMLGVLARSSEEAPHVKWARLRLSGCARTPVRARPLARSMDREPSLQT